MSKLSELLPAGAGAKSAKFVASGTLASGQAVGLKTDGTVSAISPSFGTPTVLNSGTVNIVRSTYDPDSGKVIIIYSDSDNSYYGTYVVGTVSGTSITYGTPTVYVTQNTDGYADITYDTNSNKVVIVWKNNANPYGGKAIVGTVSGTSISFGSEVEFHSGNLQFIVCGFDSSSNKVLICYADAGNSYYGTAIVGTVSGTSISFGTKVQLASSRWTEIQIAFDTALNKFSVGYKDWGNSYYATAAVLTISGTSVSAGTSTVMVSANLNMPAIGYDVSEGKFAYFTTNSSNGIGIVFSISGTSIVVGNTTTFDAGLTPGTYGCVYDSAAQKILLAYVENSTGSRYMVATISGTTITFSSSTRFDTALIGNSPFGVAYDAASQATVVSYLGANSDLYSTVITTQFSTNADFVGITDQAIANTATGSVVVQGGVITNTGLIPIENISFGSISSPASQGLFNSRMTYDSTSNRIVLAYEDATNSNYGTAVVGTVSGTSVTWGTPVVFNSASTADGSIDVVYDPDSNKSIIAYRDLGNSGHGTAIVGTVSGTAISFGAESVFSTKPSYYINITYDTSQDKVLIVFADGSSPSYSYNGYMIVGTVNGGASTISFGSEVQFESGTVGGSALSVCYDASATKSLLVYRVGTADYAASITISGTTPSIGTKNNWASVGYRNTQSVYVASSSACVIVYNNASGNLPVSSNIVAINSGSGNVTVNSSNSAISSTSLNERALVYDASSASLIYVYNSYPSGSNVLSSILGKISGTSITWSDTTVVNSTSYGGNATFPAMAYDSTSNKSVIAWRAAADSQSLVATIAATTPLVIGTDYFVQTDGTISTTSSTVPAGRALSTTSMLLEG